MQGNRHQQRTQSPTRQCNGNGVPPSRVIQYALEKF